MGTVHPRDLRAECLGGDQSINEIDQQKSINKNRSTKIDQQIRSTESIDQIVNEIVNQITEIVNQINELLIKFVNEIVNQIRKSLTIAKSLIKWGTPNDLIPKIVNDFVDQKSLLKIVNQINESLNR